MITADQISQFVSCVYLPDDWVEVRALKNGAVRKFWRQAHDLVSLAPELERLNRDGWNVYVGANARNDDGLSSDENVSICRCLFADFDHIDASDGLSPSEIILTLIEEKGLPVPTLVTFSGHGVHCYWRLLEPAAPDNWRCLQERLNAHLASDPTIKNPERIMRLPGFKNVKDPTKPVDCFIVQADPKTVYPVDEIEQALPQLPTKEPPAPLVQPAATAGAKEAKARAVLYAAKWERCGEGERNAQAFRHAAQMLRDFDLPEIDAWEIVADWNTGNTPPLDEKELRVAFQDAQKYSKGAVGSKIAESRPSRQRTPLPATATSAEPASEASVLIEAEIDGRFANVDWPWPVLTDLAQALTPGSRTLFVGGIGSSKSLALLQGACFWVLAGLRVAVLELERKRDFHLMRVLAQRTGIADVTKPKWVCENAEKARALYSEHRAFLNRVGAAIHTPERQVTTSEAAEWVERMCGNGIRLLVLDPVTILRREGDFWAEDDTFMDRIGRAVDTTGASIICVTHGKKGFNNAPDLDSLAGGAAWARFADAAVWLQSHESKVAAVKTCLGTDEVMHNRTIHLLKTRSGEGTGLRLAYNFDVEKGLMLRELGIIIKGKKD